MVSTRSQKSKEEKSASPKLVKVSVDKKKSQTKQAKQDKKKEKETVQNDQKAASAAKKKPEPKAKETQPNLKALGYTDDQYEKYRVFIWQNKSKTNEELKEMLRKNDQKVSGNKYQLADRVADGMVLGAIPKCPNCGGGRPKFDFMKGTYSCSGYRDDVDFVNCHKKFTHAEIQRKPWVL